MNILFLSNIVTPYQLDLLEEINKNNEIKIYGYFLFEKEQNRDWDLIIPEYVKVINYSKKISDYKNLLKFIKDNKIDKIILGGYVLPMTFFTIFICKVNKIDLYFWLERPMHVYKGIKATLKKNYLKFVLSQAKEIFAFGKLAVDIYSIYHSKVFNLPYSMNLERFHDIKRDEVQNSKIKFLFSGQYIDRKNIINTINAFKLIKNNNIELNLIGGGELQVEVDRLIQNDSRIKNIGFVQPKDLPYVYSSNDIFIMPSKHDGWALVINEAMASSMPIISTDKVGAVVEYIKHKVNGYICTENEDGIKKGIEYYIKNLQLISEHGKLNKSIINNSNANIINNANIFIEKLA